MQAAFKSDADTMAGAAAACEIGIAANQSAVTMSSSFEHCIGVLLTVALFERRACGSSLRPALGAESA